MADKLESAPGGRARRFFGRKIAPSERAERPRRKRDVPEISDDLAEKFVRIGNRLYRRGDDRTPIVKLEPDRLKTRNIDALPDIVRIAKANGWTAIRIEGGDSFKRAAYLAASAQGLDVENYTPAKRLKAEADQLRARFARREAAQARQTNARAASPTEVEQRRQLAARFLRQSPEENARDPLLKAAQSIVAQTLVVARARWGNLERAAREGEAKRQAVAARIARGERIAEITVRARSTPARTRQQDRPGRSR